MTQLPYQYFDESPSPSESPVSSQPNLTPSGHIHIYKAILPNVIEDDLDSHIVSFKDESLKYVCKYPVCKGRRDSKTKQHVAMAIFTSKSNARNHVRRDMNIVDAFQCTCGQTFGSEDSAKRHCNTKSAGKVHECPECGHCFERKDYWEVHVKERKCRRAHRLTPPQNSPPPLVRQSQSHSQPHSHAEPHQISPRPHTPVPQYDTDRNLIDLQPPSTSSYNHYNHQYHHYNSYHPQSCGVMQAQYHNPQNSDTMNYFAHPIGHHIHSHANYASCPTAYYA